MKMQCDVCGGDEASVFCCADEAALCDACDRKVHNANKLAGKHRRFSLSSSGQPEPLCDICKEKRGFVFCQEDRAILCWDCDDPIHTANKLTMKHSRFLLTGARLSAEPVVEHGDNKEDQEKTIQTGPVTVEESSVSSGSSISEYLTKTLPGYRVEDLLVDDADGLYKNDEAMPFLETDLAVDANEFPIWVPQVPRIQPQNLLSAGASGLIHCSYKEPNQNQQHRGPKGGSFKARRGDDSFMVPQISAPVAGNNKRSRPSSAWDF